MRRSHLLFAVALIATSRLPGQAAHAPISFKRFVLPNGLVLVVNEDHSAPLVAADIWYHLGSADEAPGQAGFAHACEHLMDAGSRSIAQTFPTFFHSIGATSGTAAQAWATTEIDYTQFYETIPSAQLETLLWAESDRMAAPFARADTAVFGVVRKEVREERMTRAENPPYGQARDLIRAALYPADNPYRGSPLAPMHDLDAATARAVVGFCRPYYVPNNAVIALSGDVSPDRALRLVQHYFGGIAKGKVPPRHIPARTPLASEQRLVLQDARARTSSIRFAWPAVGFSSPDKMPLYALAGVMSGAKYGFAKFGRLSKTLVDDLHLATSVHAELFDSEHSGEFVIDVAPRAGASLTAIELAVDSVVTTLETSLVSRQELVAFDHLNAVNALTALQPRASRTDTLAQSELWTHDPSAFAKQIAAAAAIRPQDVRRVAERYLTAGRVVMSLVPAGKLTDISKPEKPYDDVTPRRAPGGIRP